MVQIPAAAPWCPDITFQEVALRRRSFRSIAASSLPSVASVVREVFLTRFEGVGTHVGQKRKVALSAGALHPIVCVILRSGTDVLYYDDDDDTFVQIEPYDQSRMTTFIASCRMVLPECDGHWLLLIANYRSVEDYYDNPISLIWRDAGAALQALGFATTASSLAFCPLGILGQDGVDALLPKEEGFLAVGVAAIGRAMPA